MGKYADAEPLFRRALALEETAYGANSLGVAESLTRLGECLSLEEKDSEAEPILRRALAIGRSQSQNPIDGAQGYLALLLERKENTRKLRRCFVNRRRSLPAGTASRARITSSICTISPAPRSTWVTSKEQRRRSERCSRHGAHLGTEPPRHCLLPQQSRLDLS